MSRGPLVLLLLIAGLLAPASAAAQSDTWGAEADVNARYLWRGIPNSEGPVLQPYAWLTRAGTTVSAWSNMETGTGARPWEFDQLFFTASHPRTLGRWRVEPTVQGYVWRGAPGEAAARTLELAASLSRPLGPLSLTTTGTLDVASYRGAFVADGGLQWASTARRWRLETSATLAWANRAFNRTYVGVDVAAVNYAQLSVAGTRTSASGWYLRPHAELVSTLNGDVRRALGARTRASVGLAAGREF